MMSSHHTNADNEVVPIFPADMDSASSTVLPSRQLQRSSRQLQRLGAIVNEETGNGYFGLLIIILFAAMFVLLCVLLVLTRLFRRGSQGEQEPVTNIARVLERPGRIFSEYSERGIRSSDTTQVKLYIESSYKMILDEIHFQRRTQTDTTDDELSAESNDRLQEEADSDDEQQEGFSIALPLPGCEKVLGMEQAGCASGTRLVPGVCAVCLIEYTTGEEITWSSNYKCFHAFHATCMTEYIERKREIAPCPMCRQDFLAKNLTSRSMKDESASDTSDDVSISSRRSSMV